MRRGRSSNGNTDGDVAATAIAAYAGRMRRLALLAVLAAVLSACGGDGSGVSYVPASTRSALEKAGWTARSGAGMAPIAGGRQVGWLDAVSPTGAKVSLQFLESSKLASAELSAIHDGVDGTKPDPSFAGVTIANVLAFATPNGRAPLAAEVVTSLNALLEGTKHATGAY